YLFGYFSNHLFIGLLVHWFARFYHKPIAWLFLCVFKCWVDDIRVVTNCLFYSIFKVLTCFGDVVIIYKNYVSINQTVVVTSVRVFFVFLDFTLYIIVRVLFLNFLFII